MTLITSSPETRTIEIVAGIMSNFAERTGLTSDRAPRRYLWTDAFAVCNFLELYRRTNEKNYLMFAERLVEQVHQILGRHREDDGRSGWLSGLSDGEATRHPTIGGLRIGKKLPEGDSGDTHEHTLRWDRDGQYYHYLTKWMHALNQMSAVTGHMHYLDWAKELANTAHVKFSFVNGANRKRLYWKMSIDLARPLVSSMGQHDPLDGLITYEELHAAATHTAPNPYGSDLSDAIADLQDMCEDTQWETGDALGVGGLLTETFRLARLVAIGRHREEGLLTELLEASSFSLQAVATEEFWSFQPQHRLAFRELGLAIGIKAITPLITLVDGRRLLTTGLDAWEAVASTLRRYVPFGEAISQYWLDPVQQKSESWLAHGDINMVMLATSLAPGGYLAVT